MQFLVKNIGKYIFSAEKFGNNRKMFKIFLNIHFIVNRNRTTVTASAVNYKRDEVFYTHMHANTCTVMRKSLRR